MTKLEKAIKGLECCKTDPSFESDCEDKGCPYRTDSYCINCLCADALELLKEQSEKLQENINDDWSGAQGNEKERIDAQIERSEWGIFG